MSSALVKISIIFLVGAWLPTNLAAQALTERHSAAIDRRAGVFSPTDVARFRCIG